MNCNDMMSEPRQNALREQLANPTVQYSLGKSIRTCGTDLQPKDKDGFEWVNTAPLPSERNEYLTDKRGNRLDRKAVLKDGRKVRWSEKADERLEELIRPGVK